MRVPDTNHDPAELALRALVWILADDGRAERLLALTGLSPERLRRDAGNPALLAAVLGFLESHEPDLLACAAALSVAPPSLCRARQLLEDA
ncbi:DUF3572 domain-containing protein [Sphingomonas sp.]|uniref:DUF3572 domain-containing protein n=1 Tax=Sphingomonas sp. TaxID=28214 RepID=UPI001D35F9AD|nr:DUF3572 domain-containing protein [Sphingomonas sp.]MBX9797344.1 DUF3572 domain-containing protein [Sphingomonas sp.]